MTFGPMAFRPTAFRPMTFRPMMTRHRKTFNTIGQINLGYQMVGSPEARGVFRQVKCHQVEM